MRIDAAITFALLVAAPTAADAGLPLPSRANSTYPNGITVVGRDPGNGLAPDPSGRIEVVVRDNAHQGLAGIMVQLDFSAASGVRLAQTQPLGVTLDCGPGTVSAFTNLQGRAVFSVLGTSNGVLEINPMTGIPAGSAVMTAFGIYLGDVAIAIYDVAGANGLNPSDLSTWIGAFFQIPPDANPGYFHEALDYNFDYDNTPADLSILVGAVLRGGSAAAAGASYCP